MDPSEREQDDLLNSTEWTSFCNAIADDVQMLAALHDRELDDQLLSGLRSIGFPRNLALIPGQPTGRESVQVVEHAIAMLPNPLDDASRDALASCYAGIYLNNVYRASPFESAWTDDGGLLYQQSMFELRKIYADCGLRATNWRLRSEDHLVMQLQYIAYFVRGSHDRAQWCSFAQTLDEHLLYWLEDFAYAIAQRCEEPFYAGLAMLTLAWCDAFRDVLTEALHMPRPSKAELDARWRKNAEPEAVPIAFHPGMGPAV